MLTQLEFDNLQPGDILKNKTYTLEVCGKFHKAIIGFVDNTTYVYSLHELNERDYKLIKPIKYNQGFEVREYPERPVVLVGDTKPDKLRFLVAIEEETIICISEGEDRFYDKPFVFSKWKLIKKVD